MPTPPLDEVSLAAPVIPAAPRSWMPTTRLASRISRHASISRFSSNGSPTCTLLGFVAFLEPRRRQHAGPTDAVASGGRTEQHGEVAGAGGAGEGQPILGQHAETEDVDQRVVASKTVPDRRHADGVAVARHARDHAFGDPPAGRRAARSGGGRGARWDLPPWRTRRAGCRRRPWPLPRRARWPTGGCGSRSGTPPRCRRRRRPRRRPLRGRPTRAAPPTAAGAGAGGRTCTSSARTTSPRRGRARGGSGDGPGWWRCGRPRRRSGRGPGGRRGREAQRGTPWVAR